jgi:hypothetical protein
VRKKFGVVHTDIVGADQQANHEKERGRDRRKIAAAHEPRGLPNSTRNGEKRQQ